MRQHGHTSRWPAEKGGFTSNRTRAATRNTPFPLPETHLKATANDGRGLSCVEKKGGKSTREDDCSCRNSTSFNSTTPRTSCSRLEKPPQARFTVLKSSQYTATWFVFCSLLRAEKRRDRSTCTGKVRASPQPISPI